MLGSIPGPGVWWQITRRHLGSRAPGRRQGRRRRYMIRFPCVLVLASLICFLSSACGLAHQLSHAHSTPSASVAAQLVHVSVSVTQQGIVSEQNVKLVVRVVVTNDTSATIAITQPGCPVPFIVLELDDVSGTSVWTNYLPGIHCVLIPPHDIQQIPAGAEHTWTLYANQRDMAPLQAGGAYTLRAVVSQWHQGSLAQIGQSDVQYGQASGQTTIVLR
jgi:hypothetical protein